MHAGTAWTDRPTPEAKVGVKRGVGSWREWVAAIIGFMALAFLSRIATFGHPDLYVDETFYFAAGVEVLHGAVPFVDVWDRKPPGHFLLFAGIAAISDWFVTYQIVAAIFAGTTAFVIYRAARHLAKPLAAATAGGVYLLTIYAFNGYGGQSAVFYNLFMALAGASLMAAAPRIAERRATIMVCFAMLCAGLAVSIKTTAVFEAAFFGLYAAAAQLKTGRSVRTSLLRIAAWALIALLPTLAFALWYYARGYWDEYWTAMVLSNLRKPIDEAGSTMRLQVIAAMAAPLMVSAAIALFMVPKKQRAFLIGWAVAAMIGFFALPSFYLHYALPLIVPLCIVAPAVTRLRTIGWVPLAAAAVPPLLYYVYVGDPGTQKAQAGMEQLVDGVERGKASGGKLLIFDGPPLLYTLTHSHFPTPLAFPNHLYQLSERNVSHIDTLAEVKRILAERPGVIVDRSPEKANPQTAALIRDYIVHRCRRMASAVDRWGKTVTVYGLCRQPRAGSAISPQRPTTSPQSTPEVI
jgi:hypothetical protein